jgi:hypothetical protein
MPVVVADVLAQHHRQVPPAGEKDPVSALSGAPVLPSAACTRSPGEPAVGSSPPPRPRRPGRRWPHTGFSPQPQDQPAGLRPCRRRPGRRRGYVHFPATSSRCPRSTVAGVTKNAAQRSRAAPATTLPAAPDHSAEVGDGCVADARPRPGGVEPATPPSLAAIPRSLSAIRSTTRRIRMYTSDQNMTTRVRVRCLQPSANRRSDLELEY